MAKLQKMGCFVNISSPDLQKGDPDPFMFPKGAEGVQSGELIVK